MRSDHDQDDETNCNILLICNNVKANTYSKQI